MSAPQPATPPPDPQRLYERLVNRDALAPNDLATAFLEPLVRWLTETNGGIHPDMICEAADEAILALLHNPASYHPLEMELEDYLRMSAQGDLRNALNKEMRHRRGRNRLEVVELSDDDGKYLGRNDDPALPLMIEEELASLARSVPDSVRDGLTEVEVRVLELMLRKERRTSCYVEACDIADRPLEEQKRVIKQIKDRLKKRIERGGTS